MTLKTIFLLGFLTTMISCGTPKGLQSDSRSNLPQEFFQRWKIDYGTLNGKNVSGLPPSPEHDYSFNADGTYISYSTMSDNMTGSWEYNRTENCVYTRRDDGEINGIIKDIKPNSFILIPPQKSVENTPLTGLTFYYIPIVD